MSTDEVLPFLKSIELFSDFSENELNLLRPFIECQRYAKGEFILKEGEKGGSLCIIRKGMVEIVKEDGKHHHKLATFGPGECVGEMAVFDKSKRSASVRAIEEAEIVFLALGKIQQLSIDEIDYSKLAVHLTKKLSGRLRHANEVVMRSLQEELKTSEVHDQMSSLIIHMLILITSYFFVFKLFNQHASESVFVRVFSAVIILAIAFSGIGMVVRTGYPLSFYGLTMRNAGKYAIESISLTLPIMGLLLIFKWFCVTFIPIFKDLPVFQLGHEKQPFWHIFTKEHQQEEFLILSAVYILLVPIQELIVRGCLQSSFENFFRGPNKALRAIFVSNLLFMLFHGMKTFTFVFAAFMFGLFWGWLYYRQRTLVGVCISHILIGIWAFGVLGLESILIY